VVTIQKRLSVLIHLRGDDFLNADLLRAFGLAREIPV
jgi:hypothetical protein